MLFAVGVASLALILTIYLSLLWQQRAMTTEQNRGVVNQNAEETSIYREEVRKSNAALEAFTEVENMVGVSPVLGKVLAARPSGVRVYTFSYQLADEKTGGGMIRVTGVSADRRQLLAFVERLRAEAAFAEVESPLANIIQEANNEFQLTIKLAPKKT
jgi:Tfp pilus assembly protein PilN